MKKQIAAAFMVYFAAILEVTGVGSSPNGVEPQWLLLAAAHVVWLLRPSTSVLWGGLCGLVYAAFHGLDLSFGVAVLSTVAWAFCTLCRSRFWNSGVAYLLVVFLFTVLSTLWIQGIALAVQGTAPEDPKRWLLAAVAQGAITALWGGGLWFALRMIGMLVRRILPPLEWRSARS